MSSDDEVEYAKNWAAECKRKADKNDKRPTVWHVRARSDKEEISRLRKEVKALKRELDAQRVWITDLASRHMLPDI